MVSVAERERERDVMESNGKRREGLLLSRVGEGCLAMHEGVREREVKGSQNGKGDTLSCIVSLHFYGVHYTHLGVHSTLRGCVDPETDSLGVSKGFAGFAGFTAYRRVKKLAGNIQ